MPTDSQLQQRGSFALTRWSVVLAAADTRDSEQSRAALETLCRHYWYPLYVYVRRQNADPEEARELTQEFFVHFLEKNFLRSVQRERGRFRAYLLTALKYFLANERDKLRTLKRGGGRQIVSIDQLDAERRYRLEPVEGITPETLYERRCAHALLERVLARLREDYSRAGKIIVFERLKEQLSAGQEAESYKHAAEELGLSEGGIKTLVRRLRKRYGDLLRDEIAQTVDDPAEIEAEIRHLFEALSSDRQPGHI